MQSTIHVLISLIIISCMSFALSGNQYINNPANHFGVMHCISADVLEMPCMQITVEEIKVHII